MIKLSFQMQKMENSNLIMMGHSVPPIRNPLRLGKREENFSYLKTKSFHQLKELKWSQSYLKKKKNTNKNLQYIIVEM